MGMDINANLQVIYAYERLYRVRMAFATPVSTHYKDTHSIRREMGAVWQFVYTGQWMAEGKGGFPH